MPIDRKTLRKTYLSTESPRRPDRPGRDVLGRMPYNYCPDAAMLGYYYRPRTLVLYAF